MRLAAPDLELLVKTYLKTLENVCKGLKGAEADYEWIMLHLYDQTIRNKSGGEMTAYISRENIENEAFVIKLWGVEGQKAIENVRELRKKQFTELSKPTLLHHILTMLQYFRNLPFNLKELVVRRLLGDEYDALQIGRFRKRGEVHQWMYDRYSLALLLKKSGFENIIQRTASESYIPDWNMFNLDTEPDGTVYRPDSLYMEAIRP